MGWLMGKKTETGHFASKKQVPIFFSIEAFAPPMFFLMDLLIINKLLKNDVLLECVGMYSVIK